MAISKNQQALQTFAAHFDPPLAVVQTQKVGGQPVADGWMCALHLPDHEIGLTAVCWGKGYFKAWAEATGTRDEADPLGWIFANLLSLANDAADISGNAKGSSQTAVSENQVPPYLGGAASPAAGTQNNVQMAPEPLTEAERAQFADETPSPPPAIPVQPNPDFIDMGGLTPAERVALASVFPELRYAVTADGKRMRIDADGKATDDPAAGFARADQLEHVRRVRGLAGAKNAGRLVPRMPGQGMAGAVATGRLAALGDALCDHDFVKNSIGGLTTCWKCGIQGPKAAPAAVDADAEYAARKAPSINGN